MFGGKKRQNQPAQPSGAPRRSPDPRSCELKRIDTVRYGVRSDTPAYQIVEDTRTSILMPTPEESTRQRRARQELWRTRTPLEEADPTENLVPYGADLQLTCPRTELTGETIEMLSTPDTAIDAEKGRSPLFQKAASAICDGCTFYGKSQAQINAEAAEAMRTEADRLEAAARLEEARRVIEQIDNPQLPPEN